MMKCERSIDSVKVLKDNYVWIIHNKKTAIVIDPGEATPILKFLKSNNLWLEAILITHHHKDHTNGITELVPHFNPKIFASNTNNLPHNLIYQDKTININKFPTISVLDIPGHTLDHVAYHFSDHLFCGDTLFSAGCGKVFEGTYEQMYNSLLKIKSLSPSTNIYCGHEYTLQNLYFAQAVEPKNHAINIVIAETLSLYKDDKPSLPTVLSKELEINPFLRCDISEVVNSAEKYIGKRLDNEVEVFQIIREWKNNFTYKI